MTNIADLHIRRDILPLFDFTCNDFSKDLLHTLLHQPLGSVEQIEERQQILKGFMANEAVLVNYSYSRIELFEVYNFSESYSSIALNQTRFPWSLLVPEQERHLTRSKFIQAVLLFHKLHTYYIKRIEVSLFPGSYKKELLALNDFLEGLQLSYYAELIREQQFKTKHVFQVSDLLSQAVQRGAMKSFWKRFFLFEVYISISKGVLRHGFSFPVFSDATFSLEEVYHPLLRQPVRNSFSAANPVMLLTGPNMSGKSTFLKAAGLCVYLAHVGVGVPAAAATLPYFDSISISINLNDDLVSGYSHFMTEVMNLKKVAGEAAGGKRCFAIFDELFRGTNIEDAVDISATTVKGLTRFSNCLFLISTHLHQLRELDEVQGGKTDNYYIDCVLVDGVPRFSYRLQRGWSDLKVGRILFDREGLDQLLAGATTCPSPTGLPQQGTKPGVSLRGDPSAR